jgi:hypothetical protein
MVSAVGKPVSVSFSRALALNSAAAPAKNFFQKNVPAPLSDREKVILIRYVCFPYFDYFVLFWSFFVLFHSDPFLYFMLTLLFLFYFYLHTLSLSSFFSHFFFFFFLFTYSFFPPVTPSFLSIIPFPLLQRLPLHFPPPLLLPPTSSYITLSTRTNTYTY